MLRIKTSARPRPPIGGSNPATSSPTEIQGFWRLSGGWLISQVARSGEKRTERECFGPSLRGHSSQPRHKNCGKPVPNGEVPAGENN